MQISFEYTGDPVPCSRPRAGKFGVFTDQRYAEYKRGLAIQMRAHLTAQTIYEPVRVTAVFYRRTRQRVDVDNLVKSLLDAMMDAKLIADDSQVEELHALKRYSSTNPRLCFWLETIEPEAEQQALFSQ